MSIFAIFCRQNFLRFFHLVLNKLALQSSIYYEAQRRTTMTSLLTALLLSTSMNSAEAHPTRHRGHIHRPARHAVHRPAHPAPARPPHAARHYQVTHRHGHWVYPHDNRAFVWRWMPGHHNMRGTWVPGHWSVVIRLR